MHGRQPFVTPNVRLANTNEALAIHLRPLLGEPDLVFNPAIGSVPD
jgi:hypothetical protein